MKTFLISDTHFGHANICLFKNPDGTKCRPFNSSDEMDEAMVANWNSVVRPTDKVYHLGDVAIPKKSLALLSKLHGRKVLIKGNHDIFKLKEYAEHFYDIRAFHVLNGCVLSHAPLHPGSLGKFGCNIHGHIHNAVVRRQSEIGGLERDPDYINVCVEHISYTPILLDDLFQRIVMQGGVAGFLPERRQEAFQD
jgi:calcineurin-like phosphoesterase family protein